MHDMLEKIGIAIIVLVVFLGFIAGGFSIWYWTNYSPQSVPMSEARQLEILYVRCTNDSSYLYRANCVKMLEALADATTTP